jgi:hypothetical protein
MFRAIGILLLLTAAAGTMSAQSKNRHAHWLNGTWEGTGYQMDADETWTMRLTVKGNRYRIEYPSLKCEGRWRPLHIRSWTMRFREKITSGIEECKDNGNVVIQRLSRKQIAYRYADPGTSEVSASAILNRKK